jgi:hypothetical protein
MANGIARKALAPLEHVVPWSFPAGIVTLGAAVTRAKQGAAMNREIRNENISTRTF